MHQSVYELVHTEDQQELRRNLHWALNPPAAVAATTQDSPQGDSSHQMWGKLEFGGNIQHLNPSPLRQDWAQRASVNTTWRDQYQTFKYTHFRPLSSKTILRSGHMTV